MNQETKLLPVILIIAIPALLFTVLGFLIGREFISKKSQELFEGVSITHEYQATTTRNMSGALNKGVGFTQVIATSTAGITLGSVTVASTTIASMDIWDATSTDAVKNKNLATLITIFPTSTPQKTYVFDAALKYGLIVDLQAGFCGDYVITYRK